MNTKPKTAFRTRSRMQAGHLQAIQVLLLLAGSVHRTLGAASDVDLSFDPGAGVNNKVNAIATLSGDKTLIAGNFTLVHDAPISYVAWLDVDGNTDMTLRAAIYDDGHAHWEPGVYSVAVQPDGKILLGGSFATPNTRRNIVRLNTDGSQDSSFSAGALTATTDIVDSLALQSDGKIVLGGRHSSGDGLIMRLNADGSVDASFGGATLGGDPLQNAARRIIQQADDRILVGGEFMTVNGVASANLVRLNTNGSVDGSFSAPAANSTVYALILVADGKMVIGRAYDVVRLNADGSLDPAFAAYRSGYQIAALARQSDGRILCGGYNGTKIARLTADGSPDATFSATLGVTSGDYPSLHALAIQADGKVQAGGWFFTVNGVARQAVARLNADGSLDGSFLNGPAGVSGEVKSLALQDDGKVVIGGWFQRVGSAARNRIARLNADGSLDNAFLEGLSGVSSAVLCITLQSDNRILIGGDFTSVHSVARGRIARLRTDGSLDSGFLGTQAGPNLAVISIAAQPDDKVLIAGSFNRFNLAHVGNIARLNADGSLDSSFLARITPGGSGAPHLILQPDGEILVAGDFIAVNGVARTNLARLNADGSLDSTFPNGSWPAGLGAVTAMALRSDGRIVVGGQRVVNGAAHPYVARFNSDGSLDGSFAINLDGPVWAIDALALQSDGKVLVAGWPGGIVGVARTNLARLNANGSWDSSFVCSQSLPADGIGGIVRRPDGKILIGGSFGVVNEVVRPNVARLMGENSPVEMLASPQSQTAEVGTGVDFTVAATGFPVPGYQWRFNGTNILSCTNSGLELTNLQFPQSGAYSVVVSNALGAVTSSPAMLNVIAAVERRPAEGVQVRGEAGSLLNVDYANSLSATPNWLPLDTVSLVSTSEYCFDASKPLPPQRFYRAWQTGTPSVIPSLSLLGIAPAITLTGTIGHSVRLDYINQFGPTDAWVTLATVKLTNTSQLYFDTSAPGQPPRLYRLLQVP